MSQNFGAVKHGFPTRPPTRYISKVVITPFIGVITLVNHLFSAMYRGPITPLITIGSGPAFYQKH